MGLLARVRPDVAGLVLETVKGLFTEGALVRARQVLAGLVLGLLAVLEQRGHEADGGRGHGRRGGGRRRGSGGLRV